MNTPEPNIESKTWPFVLAFAKHMEDRLPSIPGLEHTDEKRLWKALRNSVECLKIDMIQNGRVQSLQAHCEWIACVAMSIHRAVETSHALGHTE